MRSTRLLATRITRLLSSTGFTIVALAVIVTACMGGVLIGGMRLLAILHPHPAWIAKALQQALNLLVALAGAGTAALAGTRLSAVDRKKRRERLRLQHPALFSRIDRLDARR